MSSAGSHTQDECLPLPVIVHHSQGLLGLGCLGLQLAPDKGRLHNTVVRGMGFQRLADLRTQSESGDESKNCEATAVLQCM